MKSLKNHNYDKCECQLKLIPQVMKAEEYLLPLKLGKKTPGKVEKLMHNQREQKQELERKEGLIKDLEGRLEQLEKKESERVAQMESQLEEAKRKLGEAHGEIKLLQMNQANYDIMLKAAKDHRDEECDNLRTTLNDVIQNLASGAKLDANTVDKVKEITDKTPNANNEEPG